MKHQLKHGQALVITGPQGSGKTSLAREIAAAHGAFAEIDATRLNTDLGLAEAMQSAPKTLIVNGIPKMSAAAIKELIASKTVRVNRKFQTPKEVATPNFIFCSGHADPMPIGEGDRRFHVIHVGSPA